MGKGFDDWVEKAKSAADITGKKATETFEISKCKMQAVQIKSNIKGKYEKLGSAVYSMAKVDYDNPELFNSIVEEIDELMEQLSDVEQKIAVLKKFVKCPCCGFNNALASQFCSHCGNKLDLQPEDDTIQVEDPLEE